MSNHPCADGHLRGANSQPTAPAHSIPAAAARISLSRSQLYELISAGEIPAIKVGSRTLICETDLRAFLDRHRAGAAAVADIGSDSECGPPPLRSYPARAG